MPDARALVFGHRSPRHPRRHHATGTPCRFAGLLLLLLCGATAMASAPPPEVLEELRSEQQRLQKQIDAIRSQVKNQRWVADVEVFSKAVDWLIRFREFHPPRGKLDAPSPYVDYARTTLKKAFARLDALREGRAPWTATPGAWVCGYVSKIDRSVQPYALRLPKGFTPDAARRWPLHVKLHGRNAGLNEVRFIAQHDGQSVADEQTWIQLDVFGRTNNAYRWAGETDVFEAIEDVRRRFRIDDRRIVLWGFSMGGAGAWHLGLHHPSFWCAVGAGAGFVDFYEYQNHRTKLPPWQDATLKIYDALPYALNAFNVPFVAYGGELDKQLLAGKRMKEAADRLGVPLKLIVGPGVGHKFHPDSFREFMNFLLQHQKKGRVTFPGRREIRFVTYTLKYNRCEWMTIEEMIRPYERTVVESRIDPQSGVLQIKTENVAVLAISRDVATDVEIDGTLLRLYNAADGLLPDVLFEHNGRRWITLDYQESRRFYSNADGRKRHDLQGPIDDAFMQPFVVVRGTGKPWHATHEKWADWTRRRFVREFEQWFRGTPIQMTDREVLADENLMKHHALILFGDPGSNAVLRRIVNDLPFQWTEQGITLRGKHYDPDRVSVSMIYPNPLNRQRYIVLNSGHTFHEQDFRASNAWLFPRKGDIAVQSIVPDGEAFDEKILWGGIFNSAWRLPAPEKQARLDR